LWIFYIPPSSRRPLDWSILRLVFEDYKGILKLRRIIHSQYTVLTLFGWGMERDL
jgi:hypothetical protein